MHHSFDISLASEFSIEEAIIIHHFQHWLRINRELKKNLCEGRTWSYQTQEWIAAHFPYWSKWQIIRIIKKLVDKAVLVEGNFNKNRYDQTKWYAFVNEGKYLPLIDSLQNRNIDEAEPLDRNDGTATPIPYSLTDTEKEEVVCPSPSVSTKIKKKTSDGKEIEVNQDDIFRTAIQRNKPWTTQQINEAWEALEKALVCNDGWRFIEGTIEKMQTKTRFAKMKAAINNGEKECQANQEETKKRIPPPARDMLMLLSQM